MGVELVTSFDWAEWVGRPVPTSIVVASPLGEVRPEGERVVVLLIETCLVLWKGAQKRNMPAEGTVWSGQRSAGVVKIFVPRVAKRTGSPVSLVLVIRQTLL